MLTVNCFEHLWASLSDHLAMRYSPYLGWKMLTGAMELITIRMWGQIEPTSAKDLFNLICTHIYIYVYIYVYMCIYIYMYIYIYTLYDRPFSINWGIGSINAYGSMGHLNAPGGISVGVSRGAKRIWPTSIGKVGSSQYHWMTSVNPECMLQQQHYTNICH